MCLQVFAGVDFGKDAKQEIPRAWPEMCGSHDRQ